MDRLEDDLAELASFEDVLGGCLDKAREAVSEATKHCGFCHQHLYFPVFPVFSRNCGGTSRFGVTRLIRDDEVHQLVDTEVWHDNVKIGSDLIGKLWFYRDGGAVVFEISSDGIPNGVMPS